MENETRLPQHFRGPGLVDLQVNGYGGFDFNANPEEWTAEALFEVRERLRRRGVLVALPTFITCAGDLLIARTRRYAELLSQEPELAATFPSLHIEGPFISPDDGPRGAHPAQYCRTPLQEPDLLARLCEASGERIGILTLAPELPGALDLISNAAALGICVALGHTAATAETISHAVEAGARMSTHLGNGSHLVMARLDNYVQAQLAQDGLFASFIADGHHMPFSTLKNFLRAKTPQRSLLVTDAIAAADVGPGNYRVANLEVIVDPDLRCHKPGEKNLAGSALTLDRAVVNVTLGCGLDFAEVWAMASSRPASLVGLPKPETVEVDVGPGGFRHTRT